jgi:uncharacterized protein YggE
MIRILATLLAVTLILGAALAQTSTTKTVQATGSATIYTNPDQAQIEVGVVTNGTTAQDSAQQNASMTTAVIAALKAVLGSSGSLQTVSYYISPRYSTATGQTNVIVGYTTSNTVRVITTDLSIIGKLIDAANQAGANNVGSLSFGLQDPEPKVQQALAQATKQAMSYAAAIATGLGGTLGAVISAQQGSAYTPVVLPSLGATGATTTPVQTGTVSVYATVNVTVQLQ